MKPHLPTLQSLCIGIFLWVSVFISAQNATVTVVVHDVSDYIVPFSFVEIKNSENQETIAGVLSDENGKAVLENITPGNYLLYITQAGFAPYSQDISVSAPTTDVGIIKMQEESQELEGLVVRAENSDYKVEIDKRVVTVGKDLVNAGALAKDVMDNIPSVSVDGETGELSLRGNSNVQVLVDGKPSNIPTDQLLQQLPSNAIDKVEIITNPSAKYNPEGKSGIINIITIKENRKGYTIGLVNGFTHGRKSRFNHSVNGNFNTGKFNFFLNYGLDYGKSKNIGVSDNFDDNLYQDFEFIRDNSNHLLKGGFDWFINDNNEMTIYTQQFFGNRDQEGYFDLDDTDNNIRYYNENFIDSKDYNQDYFLNYRRYFNTKEHYIELNSIYSIRKDDDTRYFNNEFATVETFDEVRDEQNNNLQINLDYVNETLIDGKIEAGLQFRQQKTDNTFSSTQLVTNSITNQTYNPFVQFEYTRNIFSAYTNYQKKWGKFGAQLGLRAESVTEESPYNIAPDIQDTFENDYVEFYPSAFFTYQTSETNTFSLNYSRRIDRPGIRQVTPIPRWSNPLVNSIGNPDLKPEFTNSYEIGWLKEIKGGSINLIGFYRRITDQIFRFVTADPTIEGGSIVQFINYDKADGFGMEFNFSYKINNWWRTNVSFDYFNNEIVDQIGTTRSKPYNARMNNNFKITSKLSAQHFFLYRGEVEFIQGTRNLMWRNDLGLSYSFWNKKGTLNARVNDIFNTFFFSADLDTPFPAYREYNWESQTFYIGITLNFGGKVKTRDTQDERQRGGGDDMGF